MNDTAEVIIMLGTVISMLSTISNTVSRYDRIMKRLERAQIATEDGKKEEHEMLDVVRTWQEDCAREDYEMEMSEKPKKRRVKKERVPDHPKRGRCAFILWSSGKRASVRSQLESERMEGDTSKITAGTVSKRLGAMWKEMCDEDKSQYQVQAQAEMERYRAEMKAYKEKRGETHPTDKMTPLVDAGEPVDLPEGWSGPFEGYLESYVVDPATENIVGKRFDNLEKAFAEAKRLGTACGGITIYTNAENGKRQITLRAGTSVSNKYLTRDGKTAEEWKQIINAVSFVAPH